MFCLQAEHVAFFLRNASTVVLHLKNSIRKKQKQNMQLQDLLRTLPKK